MHFATLLSIAAFAGLTVASDGVKVIVHNQCNYDLMVTKLTNGHSYGTSDPVSQGSSKTYPLPEDWQGRFFGRRGGSASDPASLAEFTFRGSGGTIDFYDISFVDGFNLPIKISPINGSGNHGCGSPTCSTLPKCPDDMKITDNGKFIGCQSACSKYGSSEYCCTDAHNSPEKCTGNSYSKVVKGDCPDAYLFAYDDQTSTFACVAQGYNVIFCP
ncbi:thaumatin [Chlamydoabsidia padenii]|nr:thaumatin [Chlamydoabsidia padenii]